MRKHFVILGLFICSLLSHSQNYTLNWQKNMPLNATGLLVDSIGNCYVGALGFKLEKYNTNGNLIWFKTNFGNTNGTLSFDRSGNIIVTSTKTSTVGNLNDIYVGKYDTSGTLLWTQTIDDGGLDNNLSSLTIDYNNNIVLFGSNKLSGSNNDFLTIKLDSNGIVKWKKTFSNTSITTETPKSITCDSINSVYIYGISKYFSSPTDSLILVKYDPNGNYIKSRNITPTLATSGQYQVNGPTNLFHFNKHIYVAASGYDALALGPPNTNLKLHRMDTALVKDTVIFQGPGITYMGIVTYPKQNFITIGGSTGTYTYNGSNYVYVGFWDYSTKINMNNYSMISYNSMGPPWTSGGPCLSLKNSTYLNYVGSMSGTLTFKILNTSYTAVSTVTTIPIATSYVPNVISGPALVDNLNNIYHLYSNTTATNFYLNKYSLYTSVQNPSVSESEISIFPNPSQSELFVNGAPSEIRSIEIRDLNGKILTEKQNANSINIQPLAQGIYIIKVRFGNSEITQKFIKE